MEKALQALSILLIVLCSFQGFGQLSIDTTKTKKAEEVKPAEPLDPIATDRPDQTESPFIVPTGHVQIESGAQVEFNKTEDVRERNYTYNTNLLKYDVSKSFELRLICEYLGEHTYDRQTDTLMQKNVGANSIAVGTKIFICEQRGIIPKTSLICHLQLPYFGAKCFRPNHLAPRFRFLMQHTISDRFTFSYNIGAEWDGNTTTATAIYTASLGIALVNRLGMFVEAYGFMAENATSNDVFNGTFANDHRFDMGFTYLLSNNLQLDMSGGVGLSKASPAGFLSCGISWRFKAAKTKY